MKNFWAIMRLRMDLGLIYLISDMITHQIFTGPTHFYFTKNVWGPVSFALFGHTNQYFSGLTQPFI